MALLTSNTSLLAPGFRKVWGDAMTKYPEQFSQIFTMGSSKRNYEEDHSITDLGLPVAKGEGSPITYDTIYDGYTKRYTHSTIALGFMVSREAIDDDLYNKIVKAPRSLGNSFREYKEIDGANILNNAFTSGLGGDGKYLCSASHPTYGGGGDYSNMPSITSDLDITSYEQMLLDIAMNFIDDRGKKLMIKPRKLVIHPSNDWMAKKILGSQKEPDTAQNAINPAQGTMPGGTLVMNYLTDADAWFVLTDADDGLQWIWRDKEEFSEDGDWDSENKKFKARMRYSKGWTNPRCIYGSAGV